MWAIYEHKQLGKKITKIPIEVMKRYEKWKDIVSISGPDGLKCIKGFHDEALKGEWRSYRSSRLNRQYRVIYKIVKQNVYVKVLDITAHDYRRK